MVNLFASSAQILGLASVVLGRWLWVRKKRGRGPADGRGHRTAFLVACALCAASSIGWGLYAAQVADERNDRLSVNLTRNSSEEGRKIVDVSLRELSFSKQLDRADGLATEELLRRIRSGEPRQILDVRESEEYEVGALEGAVHARFPDVLADADRYLDRSLPVTLLCFNGNRSSELAEELRRRGYDTSFLVGGYEKWIAEDRPIGYQLARERRDLREIADYPGKDVLLDTPEVHQLLSERDVQFVDVRYPGDFEAGHLPGAINVPFRKLTTPELEAALAALPKKPIVVPCYDKRSSFFGLVVGLRVTRMGHEFAGRYTVPEGFAVLGNDKAHVAAWKSAQEEKTLLSLVAQPLAGALTWCRAHVGSLAAAILLLVLIVRLAILPLTARAERDRRIEAGLRQEIDALKARFREDPASRSAATLALLAQHGVKPAWNLASSVVQLALFTVFFSVVSTASRGSTEPFAWTPLLGNPDPTWILPTASALALGLLVWLPAARKTWKRALGSTAAALVILALVAPLAAGPQLYLAANLTLVLVHNGLVGAWLSWRARAPKRRRAAIEARYRHAAVIPLRHAHLVEGTGAKAVRLGRLIEAGLPVPDGFVLRASSVAGGRLEANARAAVLDAHARLGATRVAVRSSGVNEDGADKSYAGVFESILDVELAGLAAAIEEVARSWKGARVDAYSSVEESGGIVVQAMVPAAWAGVVFTEHPGESGTSAIEMVEGLGDGLVAGREHPLGFRLGRASGRLLDERVPPIDLAPLTALARSVEALFGAPQDIEWAWTEGRFLLLQARDVTRFSRLGTGERALRERERHRLLDILAGTPADAAVLAQNELSELLPEPTHLSLSLMEALWGHDGAAHRACAGLGIPFYVTPDSRPLLVTAFGKLYVDERESRRRVSRSPSALSAFRLARSADRLEQDFCEEHRPRALRAARLDAALDPSRLDVAALVELFRERARRFIEEDYTRAEEINVAAGVYLETAVRELERNGLDAAQHLAHGPTTVVQEAAQLLARLGRGEIEPALFLAHSGHRAPHDWELAAARYVEDDDLVATMADRSAGIAHREPAVRTPLARKVLDLAVERALHWQGLKEEAKHLALRDVAFLRRILLALGERTGFDERIFLLRIDEVGRLDDAIWRGGRALEIVQERTDEREALRDVPLPSRLSATVLEEIDLSCPGAIPRPHASGALRGTRVSGTSGVIGHARVLRAAAEIHAFRDGEILVARFTDPTWMPLFPRARAIVTEVGGWLSHAAIQAREYDLPAVVGVLGALDSIRTGDLLRLAPDGTVEVLAERRGDARVPASVDVVVRLERGEIHGQITELSRNGALLRTSGGKLEVGEEISLEIAGSGARHATVVRNGIPGIYGLRVPESIEDASTARTD